MLDIGRIVRPHGLAGTVVVELWTNREERVAPGSRLTGGGRDLVVRSSSVMPDSGGRGRCLVTFEGVAGRDAAEALRDVVLQAEPIEVEGAMWVHRLVGADVVDPQGEPVGRVEAVEANPASDLLVLEDGRVIPLTFISEGGEGKLIVDGPPGLLDQ